MLPFVRSGMCVVGESDVLSRAFDPTDIGEDMHHVIEGSISPCQREDHVDGTGRIVSIPLSAVLPKGVWTFLLKFNFGEGTRMRLDRTVGRLVWVW